jgi:uncharacterized protein YcnI
MSANAKEAIRMRRIVVLAAVLGAALAAASSAFAHARVSPAVSVKGELQQYSLAVPTEKEGARTTKIILSLPAGFSIDSFTPSPGWQRQVQQTGSGEDAVVQKVTWTGGSTPTGEDSTFWFLAQPAKSGAYTFAVTQYYSDGSIVNWSGSGSSEDPAPTIEVKSSFGGGSSTVAIIALALGAIAVVLGVVALVAVGGKRQLA